MYTNSVTTKLFQKDFCTRKFLYNFGLYKTSVTRQSETRIDFTILQDPVDLLFEILMSEIAFSIYMKKKVSFIYFIDLIRND